jgi:hypothetical protein
MLPFQIFFAENYSGQTVIGSSICEFYDSGE